jgi:hypothetical protein
MDARRSSRRVVGISLIAGGVAVAIGGGVVAALASSDLSAARKDFETYVTIPETTPGNFCAVMHSDPSYAAHNCDVVRAGYQSSIDDASLERTLGIVGGAAGLVTAGVGTYLLLSNGGEVSTAGLTTARVWGDGQSAGLLLAGRF